MPVADGCRARPGAVVDGDDRPVDPDQGVRDFTAGGQMQHLAAGRADQKAGMPIAGERDIAVSECRRGDQWHWRLFPWADRRLAEIVAHPDPRFRRLVIRDRGNGDGSVHCR